MNSIAPKIESSAALVLGTWTSVVTLVERFSTRCPGGETSCGGHRDCPKWYCDALVKPKGPHAESDRRSMRDDLATKSPLCSPEAGPQTRESGEVEAVSPRIMQNELRSCTRRSEPVGVLPPAAIELRTRMTFAVLVLCDRGKISHVSSGSNPD